MGRNMVVKTRVSLFDLSKFFLFCLIFSINIREPFFHTREIFYVLTLMTSLFFIDIRKAKNVFILIGIWMVSVTYNTFIPGSDFELSGGAFETIIVSAYLFLLCFCKKEYANTIVNSYKLSCVVVAVITIILWIIVTYEPELYYTLKAYFDSVYNKTGLSFIELDYRMILGHRFISCWYRTSPILICALGISLIERLQGKKNLLLVSLFVAALIFSGTRANMMSAVLLLFFYIIFKIRKKGLIIAPFLLAIVTIITAMIMASLLLNDTGSASSSIKTKDTYSYLNLYNEDFIRTLLFGWGPGSTFYSLGRCKMVDVTELTFFETIRRYGIVSTIIIFVNIWFKPFLDKIKSERSSYKFFYAVVVLAYIITACTNPYLLDSVGFCALLFFTTYFEYETDLFGEEIKK